MFHKNGVVTRNPILKGMVRIMPQGVKRLMFLASLIAYVVNTRDPERDFVRNMNHVLKLSRISDESLEFPIRLSRAFWGDREILRDEIQTLTSEAAEIDKEKAALRIAVRVPEWFTYDKPEAMARDITKYFMSQHSIAHA